MSKFPKFEDFQKQKVIPNLDGLRAISILLVIFHHLPPLPNQTFSFIQNFKNYGNNGVIFFFMISGFLICTLALREVRRNGTFSLKNFYIRRSLRIFPLYYATITFVCFLVFVVGVYPEAARIEFVNKLPSYLFYYSNLIIPIKGPFSLLWSLAVEEQFYFLFSLVFFLFRKDLAGYIFLFLNFLSFVPWEFHSDSKIISIFQRAFSFQEPILLGVLLAYLLNTKILYSYAAPLFSNPLIVFLAAITVFFTLGFGWAEIHSHIFHLSLMFVVGGCVLSPSIPLLGGSFMSHIGKISYGIYLFHTIIFYGLKSYVTDSNWILFPLGTMLTLSAATISYKYFESPILNLKNQITHRKLND